jgi:hypothetical protein
LVGNLMGRHCLKDIWIYEDIIKMDLREFVLFTEMLTYSLFWGMMLHPSVFGSWHFETM